MLPAATSPQLIDLAVEATRSSRRARIAKNGGIGFSKRPARHLSLKYHRLAKGGNGASHIMNDEKDHLTVGAKLYQKRSTSENYYKK